MSEKTKHENRLAHETSPYLLQHAKNPVDWYPWGPEAIERARREKKPVFLSIGYSACHWCHVMERECFENEEIAALMNELYVNIKVDREERPDIDEIYMSAVVTLTGRGGWPLSVFLTPNLEPFFGTTYLPPVRVHDQMSFPEALIGLAKAYRDQRHGVSKQARELTQAIAQEGTLDARGALDASTLDASLAVCAQLFDPRWGGFGGAPKFPHAGGLRLCLRHYRRTGEERALAMATSTLDRMGAGGVYDQLGGGFHRYSVDAEWRVPHFEKMLYDNAQLTSAYLEAYTLTRKSDYARVARECCEWALAEMATPEGGFASSQDADSEGEEGRFFVWTRAELDELLGAQLGRRFAAYFDLRDEGNFEHGKNVLWKPSPPELVAELLGVPLAELEADVSRGKALLLRARGERVRPSTDDKVLASWNGLMAGALAQAYQVLGEPRFLEGAERAMRYVLTGMRQPDGRLFATARHGRAHLNAGLDDYAFVVAALLDLYESSFDAAWVREALALTEIVETRFKDRWRGGYFTTGEDHEVLIVRRKSLHDGALPSGAAVHALNLLRLAELTARSDLRESAEAAMESLGALAARHPQAFPHLLIALDFALAPPREIVLSGELDAPELRAMLAVVRGSFSPQRVVALASTGADTTLLPVLADKPAGATGARAYVCQNFSCRAPVDSPDALERELERSEGKAMGASTKVDADRVEPTAVQGTNGSSSRRARAKRRR